MMILRLAMRLKHKRSRSQACLPFTPPIQNTSQHRMPGHPSTTWTQGCCPLLDKAWDFTAHPRPDCDRTSHCDRSIPLMHRTSDSESDMEVLSLLGIDDSLTRSEAVLHRKHGQNGLYPLLLRCPDPCL